jgi:hypothetical protein
MRIARTGLRATALPGPTFAGPEREACRKSQPAVAGGLKTAFDNFEAVQDANIQSVDIEHLTTISFDIVQGQNVYACHGVFVLMNGRHMPGTLTTRAQAGHDCQRADLVLQLVLDDLSFSGVVHTLTLLIAA